MSDDLSEFVEKTYREDLDRGRLSAGYEAALFCIKNGQTLPEWLVPLVENAIRRDFITSEGRGRGGAKAIAQSRKVALRNFIFAEVNRLHERGIPKRDAFSIVAGDLDRHEEKPWTEEMVKKIYYSTA